MSNPRSVEDAQRSIREALNLSQRETESITQEEVNDVINTLTNTEVYLELQIAFADENDEETQKKLKIASRQVAALKKTFELLKRSASKTATTTHTVGSTSSKDVEPVQERTKKRERANETTARFISFLKSSESKIAYGYPQKGSESEQENGRVYFGILSDELKQSFEEDQKNLSDQEAVENLFRNEKFKKRIKAYCYQRTYLFLEEQTPTGHVNADEFPKLFSGSGVSYRLDNFLGGFPESQKKFADELRKEYLCSVTHHNRAAIFLQDTDNPDKFQDTTLHYAAGTGPWGGKSIRTGFTYEDEEIFSRSFAGDFEKPAKSFFPYAYARTFPDEETYHDFCEIRGITPVTDIDFSEPSPYNGKTPKRDEEFIRASKLRAIDEIKEPDESGAPSTTEEDEMLLRAEANLGIKRCRDFFFWTGDAAKLDYAGTAGLGLSKAFNAGAQGTHQNSRKIDIENGLYAVGYHIQTAGKGRPAGSEPLLYRQAFYLLPYSWFMTSEARLSSSGEVIKEPLFVSLADPNTDYSSQRMKDTLKKASSKENDFALQVRFGLHRYKGVVKDGGLLPNFRSIVKSTLLLETGPLIERGLKPAEEILSQLKYEFDGKAINQLQAYLHYDAQYQRTFMGTHWASLAFRKEPEYYYEQDPKSNRYNYQVNLSTESVFSEAETGKKYNTLGAVDPVLRKLHKEMESETAKLKPLESSLKSDKDKLKSLEKSLKSETDQVKLDELSKQIETYKKRIQELSKPVEALQTKIQELSTEFDKYICLVDLSASLRTYVPADPDIFNWPIPIKTLQSEASLSGKLLSIMGAVPVFNQVERHQIEQLYTVGMQNLATAAASEGLAVLPGVDIKFVPPVFTADEIHKVFRTAGIEGPDVPSVKKYDDYLWNGLVRAKRNLTAHPSISLPK